MTSRRSKAPHLRLLSILTLGSYVLAADARLSSSSAADAPLTSNNSDVCALLTMAEAQTAYPEVVVATPEESLAKQGIHACDWGAKPGGRSFELRLSKSSVADEIDMFEMGVMDPVTQAKLVREAIGNGQLVVGKQGDTPGVLQDIGVAAMQKGANTIVVVTTDVEGDHKVVAERLAKLAASAATRTQ